MSLAAVKIADPLDEESDEAVMGSLDKCIRQYVLTVAKKLLFLLSQRKTVPSIALSAIPSGKL